MVEQDGNRARRCVLPAATGKTLAEVTERISPHVRRIQASCGRVTRLLSSESRRIGEQGERLGKILSAIERQAGVLGSKVERLNRFCQRIAAPSLEYDPVELLEEAVLFSSRQADLRYVELGLETDRMLPKLLDNPIQVHFIISSAINCMLNSIKERGKVIVRGKEKEGGVLVEVEGLGQWETSPSEEKTSDPLWTASLKTLPELGIRWEWETDDPRRKRICLFLPATKSKTHTGPIDSGNTQGIQT